VSQRQLSAASVLPSCSTCRLYCLCVSFCFYLMFLWLINDWLIDGSWLNSDHTWRISRELQKTEEGQRRHSRGKACLVSLYLDVSKLSNCRHGERDSANKVDGVKKSRRKQLKLRLSSLAATHDQMLQFWHQKLSQCGLVVATICNTCGDKKVVDYFLIEPTISEKYIYRLSLRLLILQAVGQEMR